MDLPSLSFCTTCMGRLHHMKETLPANLERARAFPHVELMVVDYSSPDGFHEWLVGGYADEIRSGRIRYFRVPGRSLFNRSHARNVAWKNATGDFRFNLDADVSLEPGAIEGMFGALAQRPGQIENTGFLFVDQAHTQLDLWGCIGAHREAFFRVGGYNEDFGARWGLEDDDFAHRLAESGVEFFPLPHAWFRAIAHGDDERVRFHTEDRDNGLAANRLVKQEHVMQGGFRANLQRDWGAGGLQFVP